jgi:hypothetical protein
VAIARRHTNLPRCLGEDQLLAWFPARVESIDLELGEVSLSVGRWSATSMDDLDADLQLLQRDQVVSSAHEFGWEDLAEGRFVELGYYGPDRGCSSVYARNRIAHIRICYRLFRGHRVGSIVVNEAWRILGGREFMSLRRPAACRRSPVPLRAGARNGETV